MLGKTLAVIGVATLVWVGGTLERVGATGKNREIVKKAGTEAPLRDCRRSAALRTRVTRGTAKGYTLLSVPERR
jgi:hypothetical protein